MSSVYGCVYIMSGLPGSGKSYIANEVSRRFNAAPGGNVHAHIFSADDYFMKDGKYTFDPSRIAMAHQSCFRKFINLVTKPAFGGRTNVIIIDNTNLTAAEISPYYLAAETFLFGVKVLRVDAPMDVALRRQTHNVPEHAMVRMNEAFLKRDLMPWWNVNYIKVDSMGNISNPNILAANI